MFYAIPDPGYGRGECMTERFSASPVCVVTCVRVYMCVGVCGWNGGRRLRGRGRFLRS